ncbi:MAG: hypothetical protein NDJ89_09625 [Oligoflexia bacterium]|nr:hypothetical protein [Oligoflexia bacterium]
MFTKTDVITILGKRGSGKTTLARKIQRDRAFPRLVIFDRLREYSNERGPGVHFVSTFDGFGRAIRETMDAPAFKLIFQFDIEADNHDDVFNEALRVCYMRQRACRWQSSLCLVIDEVHNFASPHFIPKWLKECLLTGRHENIGLISCSQRPANVNKNILSQSHHIFCSNFNEANDFNYLKEFMGSHAAQLRTLRQYQFLHFRDQNPPQIVTS